jgi:hypothetical protein
MQLVGWAAKGVGLKEAAKDIEAFSTSLEATINDTQKVIDTTLSVENARDFWTWNRSVVNPDNWGLLKEGVQGYFDDLAEKAHPLHNVVTQALHGAAIGAVTAIGIRR